MRFIMTKAHVLCFAVCLIFVIGANAQVAWWTPTTQNGKSHLQKHLAQQTDTVDAEMNLLNYNPTLKFNSKIDVDLTNFDLSQCEIFTVFVPSQLGQEELIWKFENKSGDTDSYQDKLLFTNKRIADLSKSKFMNFIDRDLSQPQIVNYHHDQNRFSVDKLTLNDLPRNTLIPVTNFSGYLAELIIFDKRVSPITRQIIESHLALKYNVPLADGLDYLNSRGEVIFNSNDGFSNKISALGRSDALHFYQKQSQSKIGNGHIGFSVGSLQESNSKNLNSIIDNTYFLWSDNEEPLVFQRKDTKVSEFKRSWLLESNAFESSENLSFVFSHSEIIDAVNEQEFLWLAIDRKVKNDDFYLPIFYKLNKGKKILTVDNIEVPNERSIAKIYKAPTLWAYMKKDDISCDQKFGELLVVPIGGQKPYKIQIVGTENKFEELYTIEDEDDHLLLEMELGKYTINIEDQKNNFWSSEVTINGKLLQDLSLPSSLLLQDNNEIEIDAQLNQNNVMYNWTTPDQQLYASSNITISQAGIYELEVSKGNCKSWHSIQVDAIEKNIETLSVFPNPTASGHFNISASMKLPSKYQIKITDDLGRLISDNVYKEAQYILHQVSVQEPGVYMISIVTENEVKTKKLLVVSN